MVLFQGGGPEAQGDRGTEGEGPYWIVPLMGASGWSPWLMVVNGPDGWWSWWMVVAVVGSVGD